MSAARSQGPHGWKKMNKITIEPSQVTLRFNLQFYSQKHIDAACDEFRSVCKVNKTEDSIILAPNDASDTKILGYEFYNYVLALMKSQ